MNPFAVRHFGWTLLHFAWQGIALAALLGLLLFLLPRKWARLRYALGCVTLLAMIVAVVSNYWLLRGVADVPGALVLPRSWYQPASLLPSATTPAIRLPNLEAPEVQESLWRPRLDRFLPPLLLAWLCVGALLALWHGLGCVGGGRFVRQSHPIDPSSSARFASLARRMGLRRPIQFLASDSLETPVTLGWIRPVVVLPTSTLMSVASDRVDAVVAHELAHIRRFDYPTNILQSLVETLLFFHPATWWVSRQVRAERERCCDQDASAVVGVGVYAHALRDIERLRPDAGTPQLALSAADGSIVDRVRHLVGQHRQLSLRRRSATVASLLALVIVSATAAQILATSVLVPPPRQLRDMGSLSAYVYATLGVPQASGDDSALLLALHDAIAAPDAHVLERLSTSLNAGPSPDALMQEMMLRTKAEAPFGYEQMAEWQYGTRGDRIRVVNQLWEKALASSAPQARRRYARAAILLAAQDCSVQGVVPMRTLLNDSRFAEYAQLSPSQHASLARQADDHRQISIAAMSQRFAVEGAMKLEPPALLDVFIHAADRIIEMAPRRPDVQLQLAKLLSNIVAAHPQLKRDANLQQSTARWIQTVPDPQFKTWIAQALDAKPTTRPIRPRGRVIVPGEMRLSRPASRGTRSG